MAEMTGWERTIVTIENQAHDFLEAVREAELVDEDFWAIVAAETDAYFQLLKYCAQKVSAEDEEEYEK